MGDKPSTLYVIYNVSAGKIESNRLGNAYIQPMDAVNEIRRLKYLYPNTKYEMLEYERWK